MNVYYNLCIIDYKNTSAYLSYWDFEDYSFVKVGG